VDQDIKVQALPIIGSETGSLRAETAVQEAKEPVVQCQPVGQSIKEQAQPNLCSETGPETAVQEAREPVVPCQSVGEDTSCLLSSSDVSNIDKQRQEPALGDVSMKCQYPSNQESVLTDTGKWK
jgi:hypothetical protein